MPTNSNIASTTFIKRKQMARFIDPRVDWAFKSDIWKRRHENYRLITFLNGLFEDELVIMTTFAKTEKLGLRPDDRGVVFDVYCITNEGRHVIVEMQKKEQEYFTDRALYITHGTCHCKKQGIRGIWDYHLAPVYTVHVHGLCIAKSDIKGVSHRSGTYRLADTPASVRQDAVLCTSSCHCSTSTQAECMDIFDCWIYIVKNMNMFETDAIQRRSIQPSASWQK